jgi:hypothetical protein
VGGRAERQREQGRILDRLFERSGEGERDLDLVEMGFVEEVEGGTEGRKGGRKGGRKEGGRGGEVLEVDSQVELNSRDR